MGGGRPRKSEAEKQDNKRRYMRSYMQSYRIKKAMFGVGPNEPLHRKTEPFLGLGRVSRSTSEKVQVGDLDGQPIYKNIPTGKHKDPFQVFEERREKEENSR